MYVRYSFIPVQIWNHYDSDRSGYLEGEEIEAFLKDMLEQQGSSPSPQRISDYKDFIVRRYSLSTSNISLCKAIFTFILGECENANCSLELGSIRFFNCNPNFVLWFSFT